jgi:hypothetical protein
MKTTGFSTKHYIELFKQVGHPLTAKEAIPEDALRWAEERLGIRLPTALRSYYSVAGRETRLNTAFNRLLQPADLELHEGKLVFMAENQNAAFWGVPATRRPALDPVVHVTNRVAGALSAWEPECRRCSVFLDFMVHMHASFGGGSEYKGSAAVPHTLLQSLDQNWKFAGEVKKMRAYSRDGKVVCFSQWQDFMEEKKHWRVFCGSSRKDGLEQIAQELLLEWD